jgi:hypothetical protein
MDWMGGREEAMSDMELDHPGALRFVCMRNEGYLRLHLYTTGGTLMSSLQSVDAGQLKAITVAWLRGRGLTFDEGELDEAIGRAEREEALP